MEPVLEGMPEPESLRLLTHEGEAVVLVVHGGLRHHSTFFEMESAAPRALPCSPPLAQAFCSAWTSGRAERREHLSQITHPDEASRANRTPTESTYLATLSDLRGMQTQHIPRS